MNALTLARNLATRSIVRRRYHADGHHRVTTLNDLPSPQGSWKTDHDAKQGRKNMVLIGGIGALIGTIVFGKAAGLLEFHNDYPERPADIPSYR